MEKGPLLKSNPENNDFFDNILSNEKDILDDYMNWFQVHFAGKT